jgi:hypothetical protein
MTKVNKKVAIVCSTGITATNYTEFGAKTLHKWSGIEDGRHLDEELIHLVKTDERFLFAKNNIETVQTLIVDEISRKDFPVPPCPVISKLWPFIAKLKADI